MKITDTAHRLQELMQELNLSQKDVCARTGMDRSTLSLYVTGKRIPKQNKIALISDLYHLDPAWLMGYDVPMRRSENLSSSNTDTIVDYVVDDGNMKLLIEIESLTEDERKDVERYMAYLKSIRS